MGGYNSIDLKEIGINTRNWVDSAQDSDYWRALVNATLILWVPKAMELDTFSYPGSILASNGKVHNVINKRSKKAPQFFYLARTPTRNINLTFQKKKI